jgi:NadR type nicotinamide-nucleotide adenylyltransferase
MNPFKKIVIIGPESTGKSTLCESLAAHYGTRWVPEYAREYLLKHGKNYSYEELLTIAKGQAALEDECMNQLGNRTSSLLFIDTNMYVMKVWCEFVFGKCHPWILDQILTRNYDGYLLCRTDLPWVKDELREYPDPVTREKLFRIYKDILINQDKPWAEIGGEADQRLESAVRAVDGMFS